MNQMAKIIRIVGVQPEDIMDVWPYVKEYFASFETRAKGFLTASDLLTSVIDGKMQCWIAVGEEISDVRACGLTEIPKGRKKVVVFSFCSGKGREDWRDAMVDEIERWSRHIGADTLRIICRPGWTKEIKSLGYRETHRILDKEL